MTVFPVSASYITDEYELLAIFSSRELAESYVSSLNLEALIFIDEFVVDEV